MPSILEAFANDNLLSGPRFFEQHSDYGKTLTQLTNLEEQILYSLSEDERKQFEKFNELQSTLNSFIATDKFVYGYRLGVLMTMEVLNSRNDLIIEGKE